MAFAPFDVRQAAVLEYPYPPEKESGIADASRTPPVTARPVVRPRAVSCPKHQSGGEHGATGTVPETMNATPTAAASAPG